MAEREDLKNLSLLGKPDTRLPSCPEEAKLETREKRKPRAAKSGQAKTLGKVKAGRVKSGRARPRTASSARARTSAAKSSPAKP